MKKYLEFNMEIAKKIHKEEKTLRDIQDRLQPYIDMERLIFPKVMPTYRIPVDDEIYFYCLELLKKYPYITHESSDRDKDSHLKQDKFCCYSNDILVEYSKKDYDEAVAYCINFWYMAYAYDDQSVNDYMRNYYKKCCEHSSWGKIEGYVQCEELQMPPREMKKKFGIFSHCDGAFVASEIKDLLIEKKMAEENDFWHIKTRKMQYTQAYQIMPINKIKGFSELNKFTFIDKCNHCGNTVFNSYTKDCEIGQYVTSEPWYINQKMLYDLGSCACTEENFCGIHPEDLANQNNTERLMLSPLIIISKEMGTVLWEKYPKIKKQLIPIFLKE